MLTHFKNSFIVRLAGNLQQGNCYISHHTYNLSLHYFVKNIMSKIEKKYNVSNTISPFCLIVDKTNQMNLIGCVLLSHTKC